MNKISKIKKIVLSLIISAISVIFSLSIPIFGENNLLTVTSANPQTGDMVIVIALVLAAVAVALLVLLQVLKKK